jgi:hypothetical protein
MGLPSWMLGKGVDTDMEGEYSGGNSEEDRLYLKQGETRLIVFLTEGTDSIGIWEHQVYINGSWRNWATCLQSIGKACKLCQYAEENDKYRRYKAQYFSVIDETGWKDKKGNWHRPNRVMIPAKKQTVELLQRRYLSLLEDGKGLKGARFEVFRSTAQQSASVGTDWTFKKHVDLDDFVDISTAEHDFATLLAPDEAKINRFYDMLTGGGSGPDDGSVTNQEVQY